MKSIMKRRSGRKKKTHSRFSPSEFSTPARSAARQESESSVEELTAKEVETIVEINPKSPPNPQALPDQGPYITIDRAPISNVEASRSNSQILENDTNMISKSLSHPDHQMSLLSQQTELILQLEQRLMDQQQMIVEQQQKMLEQQQKILEVEKRVSNNQVQNVAAAQPPLEPKTPIQPQLVVNMPPINTLLPIFNGTTDNPLEFLDKFELMLKNYQIPVENWILFLNPNLYGRLESGLIVCHRQITLCSGESS